MPRKTISLDQLDNFSVDTETRELFWQDKKVVTLMSLPWWVQVSALAGGLGTAVSAVVAVVGLFIKH
jgi:hypothetical protein